MKEYIQELREFRDEFPDEWPKFLGFLETQYSHKTRRAVELFADCKTQKEAFDILTAEGLKMAHGTASSRLVKAKSVLWSFERNHPLTLPAKLAPSQIKFLEESINGMLRPYGLELGSEDFFEGVPVRKINGKRFEKRMIIDVDGLEVPENYPGVPVIV